MKIASRALVCVIVYVGAYLSLLTPDTYWFCSLGCSGLPYQRKPLFRVGGEQAKTVFSPLLRLDQIIRPTYWSGVKLFDGRLVSGDDPSASGLAPGGGFSGSIPNQEPSSESSR
jgi:hypothetical protein